MPIPIQSVSSFQRSGGMPGIVGQDLPNSVAQLNAQSGTATLVGGTVTVTGVTLTATSIITATANTLGGTQGMLRVPAANRTLGAALASSFVITSSSATDTSTVDFLVLG